MTGLPDFGNKTNGLKYIGNVVESPYFGFEPELGNVGPTEFGGSLLESDGDVVVFLEHTDEPTGQVFQLFLFPTAGSFLFCQLSRTALLYALYVPLKIVDSLEPYHVFLLSYYQVHALHYVYYVVDSSSFYSYLVLSFIIIMFIFIFQLLYLVICKFILMLSVINFVLVITA